MQGNRLPAHGALSGVRIADFTWLAAGPYGTQLLSFLGAEVIRFESRRRMDSYRRTSTTPGVEGRSRSLLFNDVNLNKMSVTVDLSTPEGIALALDVVRVSDVVADNFSPGVMQRLGLGYDRLRRVRPDIIVIASSSCGSDGPESRSVGYAPTFSALAGWGHLMGFPDMPPAESGRNTDLRVGAASAFALLAALNYRASTGRGQSIDLSAREALTCSIGDMLLESQMTGRTPMRQANRTPGLAPHGVYRCKGEDAWVTIAVGSDEEWAALCAATGHPDWRDDSRFLDVYERCRHQDELDSLMAEWTLPHTPAEASDLLQKVGVAAMPCLSNRDLLQDRHLRFRGSFSDIEHSQLGPITVMGAPWKFSDTPVRTPAPSPLVGQHTGWALADLLGRRPEEIARLTEANILY